MYLSNLGNGLRVRYARGGALADLEAAIAAYRQAVEATSADSPDRPAILNNLGAGLRDHYARSGSLADLEAAITAYRQAVEATPADSPARPGRLNNLGIVLRDRYTGSGSHADLEAAITGLPAGGRGDRGGFAWLADVPQQPRDRPERTATPEAGRWPISRLPSRPTRGRSRRPRLIRRPGRCTSVTSAAA